jgi:hypothetical protein
VARLRLRQVLRPQAGALLPGNDAQAAHPAASRPSAESTVSVTRPPVQANEKPISKRCPAHLLRRFPSGSLVESGLMTDAIRVHRAVCHRHPQFTAIRCLRASRSYREQGLALDCMISDATVGWNIASWSFIGGTSGLCSEFGGLVSGCQTGVHRQPIAWTRWISLRQQRSTLVEDSKQGLHNKFFTGGGWA